jgi:hypothetical protein
MGIRFVYRQVMVPWIRVTALRVQDGTQCPFHNCARKNNGVDEV